MFPSLSAAINTIEDGSSLKTKLSRQALQISLGKAPAPSMFSRSWKSNI